VATLPGGGRGTGAALLARAEEEGADLLVMGGYGHPRLREVVLGGTTRHVLAHAAVPVLLSH
jgi:nucleotide-binding universal stress UspA family protein